MAGILKACLKEARNLQAGLEDTMVSPKDGCVTRVKKNFKALRKRGLIESRSENIERWKALLLLCISEINSKTMHATSRDLLSSVDNSYSLTSSTSVDVRSLVDALPAIFTQFTIIERRLHDLDRKMNATSAEPMASARLTKSIEHVIQHFMVGQQGSLLSSHFGSNFLTHYVVPCPVPRHKSFSCFADTVKQLEQLYSSGTTLTERNLTLAGVACGGKTWVALEFCEKTQKDAKFGGIFWIKASSAAAIRKSFGVMASHLNIDKKCLPEIRVQVMMGVLSAWPCRWLMVFDNYNGNDAAKDLGDFMPQSEQGVYLLTRRLESLTSVEKKSAILLPPLQLPDALELLLNRSAVERNDDNYEPGLKLVRALGKVPRIIVQVASYIKKHKISFEEYHRMLRNSDSRTVIGLLKRLDSWKI
ncbi:hypothetical protein N431DRAFT_479522 [Stipitochalara longipes BDJ]|nr:hypothetical protein N431DRAFT_479522 [Stipitochalara longipes BDJ]